MATNDMLWGTAWRHPRTVGPWWWWEGHRKSLDVADMDASAQPLLMAPWAELRWDGLHTANKDTAGSTWRRDLADGVVHTATLTHFRTMGMASADATGIVQFAVSQRAQGLAIMEAARWAKLEAHWESLGVIISRPTNLIDHAPMPPLRRVSDEDGVAAHGRPQGRHASTSAGI